MLSSGFPHAAAQSQEDVSDEQGLQVVGVLPEPPDDVRLLSTIGALDPATNRMYYFYRNRTQGNDWFTIEYDLDAGTIPEPIREIRLGTNDEFGGIKTPFTFALDGERRRLYHVGAAVPFSGYPIGPGSSPNTLIHVIDLDTLQIAEVWPLAQRGLEGFQPFGITYAPEDDRIYLVGEFVGNGAGQSLTHSTVLPVGPGPAIVALDAASGHVRWVRPIQPPCQQVLVPFNVGAMVARSDEFLYVFCQTGGGAGAVAAYPGQAGLVRMDVAPNATQADAVGSEIEFFPAPGAYGPDTGIAVHDHEHDRVFVNSLSERTPGAFVFDERRSAWVGHIAAPDDAGRFLTVNPGTGRVYIAGGAAFPYIMVSDGAATPPPQGAVFDGRELDDDDGIDPNSFVVADPNSDRIFVKDATRREGLDTDYLVLEDRTTVIEPLPPPDFDANTSDMPEGPDTFVNYTVVSSGFGAMGRLVGGAGNVGSYGLGSGNLDPFATLRSFGVDAEEPVVVSQGDRTVTAADVPSVQLAAFGAVGDAQALATDDGTTGEINEGGTFAGEQGVPEQVVLNEEDDEDGDERQNEDEQGGETAVPVTDAAGSPYRKVECSDNGFDDDTTERSDSDDVDAGELEGTGAGTGHARVVCDLAGQQSRATASWRAGPTADGAAGPAVAAAGFDTHLSRDPEQGGAGTETVAVASGIELPVPEGGTLHIGEVRARAVTAAAGRPSTTRATWTRTLSGVVVTDPDGAQVFPPEDGAGSEAGSCATVVTVQSGQDEQRQEADNCGLLVDALNTILQTKVQVSLPTPDMDATPGGAYAQVRQTEADFHTGRTLLGDSSRAVPALQLLITNDGTEKSRLLLHLAAIDTSTIYQIQPCPFCSFDGGTDPDPAPDPTTEPASPTPAATATSQPAVESAAAPPPTPPVSLPAQEPDGQSIDLAAAQPSTSEPEVAPQQALSLPGRIGAGLQLLTRDPVQALLVGGVWLLFAGALTTLLRRIRLRQLVSS